jgi:hypothetical protein
VALVGIVGVEVEACRYVITVLESQCLSIIMSFRAPRNQPSLSLAIHPHSQSQPQALAIPANAYPPDANTSHSPRRTPLPLSPTHSIHPGPWPNDRNHSYSTDVHPGGRDLPSLPTRSEKRLPLPPNSPHQVAKGVYAGAYDNKLVCLLSS